MMICLDEKEKCNKKVKKEKKRIFAMKCPIRAQKSLSRVDVKESYCIIRSRSSSLRPEPLSTACRRRNLYDSEHYRQQG